jgi:hypothetical protein
MAETKGIGCARPTGGLVGESEAEEQLQAPEKQKREASMIRVGQKAPDFMSPAYYKGEFTSIKLSDYLGKWTALCFYPGDFTFV